jgi:hypothetical protein
MRENKSDEDESNDFAGEEDSTREEESDEDESVQDASKDVAIVEANSANSSDEDVDAMNCGNTRDRSRSGRYSLRSVRPGKTLLYDEGHHMIDDS